MKVYIRFTKIYTKRSDLETKFVVQVNNSLNKFPWSSSCSGFDLNSKSEGISVEFIKD